LQDFLTQVRGKSPQAVLGIVAASGLTQGIILSTLATAVVLLIFTALPFYMYGDEAAAEAAKAKAKAQAVAQEKAEQEAAAEAAEKEEAELSEEDKKAAAVKAMTEGLEETKGSTANDVPEVDNLLDKLD
jgi:FKBP-type peptidyl-prolyl cis-trans isomerase